MVYLIIYLNILKFYIHKAVNGYWKKLMNL